MTITLTAPIGPNFAQGTVTATDEAITLVRFITWNFCGIQITGTWSGTITFEATVDGTNWVAISVTPFASVTLTSTATANGCWSVQNVGFAGLRARFSTASSGTPKITIKSLPSQA
jgi:hypothetical protein